MKNALVLYGATDLGASEFSADVLWATGFKVPDPVLYIQIEGRKILMVSPLEVERADKEARVDEVILQSSYRTESNAESPLISFLKKQGVTHVTIPESMRYSIAAHLHKHFEVSAVRAPFGKERSIKRANELKEIESAQRAVERAVGKGIAFLREAEIRGEEIWHASVDHAMMSADLRRVIDGDLYDQGYLGIDSIVVCGVQAADPHCRGAGLLRPYQPIVLDIFPRSLTSLYFADQTRTVFKGEPSDAHKKMYAAVLDAQEKSLTLIKPGVQSDTVMQCARDILDAHGFKTSLTERPVYGFIHGLGHGVGIEIHESPSIGRSGDILEEGMVVTVEPGLYYSVERPGIPVGGIRIEDMVVVTKDGCRNFTTFAKHLEDSIV
ncbi:aminopeptidase P family protein [Candidatus Uhrbacteria bacterium]|nr:aminopeptidase P family protein [Candidatus Uhrbacteria bacterium]